MKKWFIEKLGGFTDIDEAIDSVTDVTEKRRILSRAVKTLYNVVGADDILRVHDSGQWMLAGKPLSEGQKKVLIVEATHFLETDLWKVLQADVKWQANRRMYLLAKDEMDVIAGKLWTYTLDAFKTRLESMREGKGVFNSKAK